jgi:hypothetical protein
MRPSKMLNAIHKFLDVIYIAALTAVFILTLVVIYAFGV